MASTITHGVAETASFHTHIQLHLKRLVQQLSDLETYAEELDAEEVDMIHSCTRQSWDHFQNLLQLSLMNEKDTTQANIQSAIKAGFETTSLMETFQNLDTKFARQKVIKMQNQYANGEITKEELHHIVTPFLLTLHKRKITVRKQRVQLFYIYAN